MPRFTHALMAGVLAAASLTLVGGPPAYGSHGVAGDIDGDGFADLVVGSPGEAVNGRGGAGAVTVIYGSDDGLAASGDEFIHQDSPLVGGKAETGDAFGSAIALGDFDDDGYADVAVGAPGEDTSVGIDAGLVHVFYGSRDGLVEADDDVYDGGVGPGTTDPAEAFGSAVVAGDFNGDRRADLAIGAPRDDVGENPDAGTVTVLYGSGTGLVTTGADHWHQDVAGVKDEAEFYEDEVFGDEPELFGSALGRRDFDGDAYSDLAIGVPGEAIGGAREAGAVNVLYGSATGLTAERDDFWHQDANGVKDHAEAQTDVDNDSNNIGDAFGSALAAADFDGDGYGDLAIGVPTERVKAVDEAPEFQGAVNVLYGSSSGLGATGDDFWHQDSPGVKGAVEAENSRFGAALAAGDLDGDGVADLAIGAPREGLANAPAAGAVHVLFGSGSGLTADGDQLWHQDRPGVKGGAEGSDLFGSSLVARNFGRSRRADLAIGVPGEDHGDIVNAGRVQVLYGTSGGPTADGDQEWHQDSPGIKGTAEEGDGFGTV